MIVVAGPPTAPARDRSLQRNVPVFYLLQIVTGFFVWAPIWILYLTETRGSSLGQVALMEAALSVAVIAGEVPTGVLADRWGRRAALVLGWLGYGASALLFAFASSLPPLVASFALMGLSWSLVTGAAPALLYDTLRSLGAEDRYERHLGRAEAGAQASALAAILLGGPLVYLVGFQGVVLAGAFILIAGGCVALLLREPPRGAERLADARRALAILRDGIGIAVRRRPILWLICFASIALAVLELPGHLFQLFLEDHGILPDDGIADGAAFSAWWIPIVAGGVTGSLLAAPLASRLGDGRALPASVVLGLAAYAAIAATDHLGLAAAAALAEASRSAARPIAYGYINRRIDSARRATVLSVFELAMGVAWFAVILAVVPLADRLPLQAVHGAALAILCGAGLPLGLLWFRAHRRPPPGAAA